jgi:hypothetical protein
MTILAEPLASIEVLDVEADEPQLVNRMAERLRKIKR